MLIKLKNLCKFTDGFFINLLKKSAIRRKVILIYSKEFVGFAHDSILKKNLIVFLPFALCIPFIFNFKTKKIVNELIVLFSSTFHLNSLVQALKVQFAPHRFKMNLKFRVYVFY